LGDLLANLLVARIVVELGGFRTLQVVESKSTFEKQIIIIWEMPLKNSPNALPFFFALIFDRIP